MRGSQFIKEEFPYEERYPRWPGGQDLWIISIGLLDPFGNILGLSVHCLC